MLKTKIFCRNCKTIENHTEMPIGDFCIKCGTQSSILFNDKKITIESYNESKRGGIIGISLILIFISLIALFLYKIFAYVIG
tara:strand:- start:1738 stop:1983 length:246 start_codon:yes stop_codon:yes gene_type:complete